MLGHIFIGIYAFVLMGIPILVVIAFIYGLIKANSKLKHHASVTKNIKTEKRTRKWLLPNYDKSYKIIAKLVSHSHVLRHSH